LPYIAGNSTGEGSGEFRAPQRRHATTSHKRCFFRERRGDLGRKCDHRPWASVLLIVSFSFQK